MAKEKDTPKKNSQFLKAELPEIEGVRPDCDISPKTIQRFLSYVRRSKSCWKWEGSFTRDGYGQFWLTDNKVVKAHRLSFEIFRAPVSEKTRLKNICGNKQCMNPYHWEIYKAKDKRE